MKIQLSSYKDIVLQTRRKIAPATKIKQDERNKLRDKQFKRELE